MRYCRGAVLMVLFSTLIPAGETSPPPPDQPLSLRLPAQIELAALTDLVGATLRLPLQVNPQKVHGQVKLTLPASYRPAELWSIFNQVLRGQGLTTVLGGDPAVFQVVPIGEAAGLSRLFMPSEFNQMSFPPGYAAVLVDLRHLPAEVAVQMITPLLGTRQGQVSALGREQGSVLISCGSEQMGAVLRILAAMDVEGMRPGWRLMLPRLAAPQRLQATVTAAWNAVHRLGNGKQVPAEIQITPDGTRLLLIAPEASLDGLVKLTELLDAGEPLVTTTYRPRYFSITDVAALIEQVLRPPPGSGGTEARIVRDTLTGSLIITASQTQHERVVALLKDLDQSPTGSQREMRVFPVRFRSADDMAKLLKELLAGGTGTRSDGQPKADLRTGPALPALSPTPVPTPGTAPQPAPGTPTAAGPDATAGLPADPGRRPTDGSLRLGGTDTDDLVLTVDIATNTLVGLGTPRRLDQVAGLLARLDARQPQVELEVIMVALSDSQGQEWSSKLSAAHRRGQLNLDAGNLLGLGVAGASSPPLVFGPGLTLGPGDFAGLINTLETVAGGRNFIRTKVVVDNGNPAKLDAVIKQPIALLNRQETNSTTTYAGTSDAGTQIEITPQISAGDHVTLTYSLAQSSFEGNSEEVGVPPPKRSDNLSSVATIPDGHVIALGGITSAMSQNSRQGLPYLVRIPLLGWLFGKKTDSSSHSRFYVFVRAEVLRHPAFADLSRRAARPAAEAGVPDEAGPKLKPRFIE